MYSRLAGGFLKLGIPYFVVLSFFSVVDIFAGPSKSSSFFTVISLFRLYKRVLKNGCASNPKTGQRPRTSHVLRGNAITLGQGCSLQTQPPTCRAKRLIRLPVVCTTLGMITRIIRTIIHAPLTLWRYSARAHDNSVECDVELAQPTTTRGQRRLHVT